VLSSDALSSSAYATEQILFVLVTAGAAALSFTAPIAVAITLLLLIVGAATALALSEGLRKKVLDALFGAEEEFEYTSTTTPASSGSEQPVGAS
jgi:hypothetical protein